MKKIIPSIVLSLCIALLSLTYEPIRAWAGELKILDTCLSCNFVGGNISGATVSSLAGVPSGSGTSTGANTGDVALSAVGATPNADGASLSGQVLTLQPADATHPGALTASAQAISGVKTFMSGVDMNSQLITNVSPGLASTDAATVGQISAGVTWVSPIAVPYVLDDSQTAPPATCLLEDSYIAAASSGVWTAGHLYECATASPSAWTDIGTIAAGSRVGVTFNNTASAVGSFTGKDKYIFEVTGGTPGAYTYTQTAPTSGMQVFVDGVGGIDYRHVYWYNAAGATWIDTQGGAVTNPAAGNALSYSGNTLNVGYDNVSVGKNGSNQLTLLAPQVPTGRLTLTSGVPITTADVTAATTVYFTAGTMTLWNGSAWQQFVNSQLSVAVPATTNTMYDAYACYNAGTPNLQLVAWAGLTTQPTRGTQNGFDTKNADATCLYVGVFKTTGVSGQTEDSLANRFLANHFNKVKKPMKREETAASWTYSTAVWRQANANTANQLNFVIESTSSYFYAANKSSFANSITAAVHISLGLDSTSTPTTDTFKVGTTSSSVDANYYFYPGSGYHFISAEEYVTSGTATFNGAVLAGTSGAFLLNGYGEF